MSNPIFSARVSLQMYNYIEHRRLEANVSRSQIITHLISQSPDYQNYLHRLEQRHDRYIDSHDPVTQAERIISIDDKLDRLFELINIKQTEREAALHDKITHIKAVLVQLIQDYHSNTVPGVKRNSFTHGIEIIEKLVFEL